MRMAGAINFASPRCKGMAAAALQWEQEIKDVELAIRGAVAATSCVPT
jgi:hypothetical protein